MDSDGQCRVFSGDLKTKHCIMDGTLRAAQAYPKRSVVLLGLVGSTEAAYPACSAAVRAQAVGTEAAYLEAAYSDKVVSLQGCHTEVDYVHSFG